MSRGLVPIQSNLIIPAASSSGCSLGKVTYYYRKSDLVASTGTQTLFRVYVPADKCATKVKLRIMATTVTAVNTYLATTSNYVIRTDIAQDSGVPTMKVTNSDVLYNLGDTLNVSFTGTAAAGSNLAYFDVIYSNAVAYQVKATTLARVTHMYQGYTTLPLRINYRGNNLSNSLRWESINQSDSFWSSDNSVANHRDYMYIAANNTNYSLDPIIFPTSTPSVGEALVFIDYIECLRSKADADYQLINYRKLVWKTVNAGVPTSLLDNTPFGASTIGATTTFTGVAGTSSSPPRLNIVFTATSSNAVGTQLEIRARVVSVSTAQ